MPETYTGDEGTIAANAGMTILDGTEDRRTGYLGINKARDYLATKIAELRDWVNDQLEAVWPISKGGTGATSASQARTNLGFPALGTADLAQPNRLPVYNGSSQLTTQYPALGGHAANKQYVDDTVGRARQFLDDGTNYSVLGRGLAVTGSFYTGGATPATSGYVAAYINGDGRIAKGASSRRYKENITDAPDLGDIWPRLREFQMIGGDGDRKIGYIAEELLGTPAERFVVWADLGTGPIPDSIDFIALLIAQNHQLHHDLDLLAQRLDALEAGNADH